MGARVTGEITVPKLRLGSLTDDLDAGCVGKKGTTKEHVPDQNQTRKRLWFVGITTARYVVKVGIIGEHVHN